MIYEPVQNPDVLAYLEDKEDYADSNKEHLRRFKNALLYCWLSNSNLVKFWKIVFTYAKDICQGILENESSNFEKGSVKYFKAYTKLSKIVERRFDCDIDLLGYKVFEINRDKLKNDRS